jgi:UDP-N-acetylmuramoylalanine--D-glutamate ligase
MGKKIVVLGAGESGVGAAILSRRMGYEVFVTDAGRIDDRYLRELSEHDIPFEQGGHDLKKVREADEVVKSPGIPHTVPVVREIRSAGIDIISDIELAYRGKGDSMIVGITGSNGKTTTTSLIYHICRHAGLDCAIVGNVGFSIARQVALSPRRLYVTEISSFQLDDIREFRPDVAVLTNITEDHLDRYGYVFENYIRAKFNITKNQKQSDHFIYCADDPVTMAYMHQFEIHSNQLPITMNRELPKGAYLRHNLMTVGGHEPLTMGVHDFTLKGKHNQYNTMAACLASSLVGIRKERIREAVATFESLEHRMEKVATVRGVEFINDSKATNVNSTWYALESMTRPVILILGGVDKGNDYSLIMEMVREKVKAIVCLGKDNTKLHSAFGKEVGVMVNAETARDAVMSAFRLASKGDVVLLSPACASFDLFSNYEDRGNQFKQAVRDL